VIRISSATALILGSHPFTGLRRPRGRGSRGPRSRSRSLRTGSMSSSVPSPRD